MRSSELSALRKQQREQLSTEKAIVLKAFETHGDGLNLRARKDDRWVMILPDVQNIGGYRLQYFDCDGFIAHSCFNSSETALNEAFVEGYINPDPGRLDILAQTDRWKFGMEKNAIIQKLNSNLITWKQAEALMREVGKESSSAAA